MQENVSLDRLFEFIKARLPRLVRKVQTEVMRLSDLPVSQETVDGLIGALIMAELTGCE